MSALLDPRDANRAVLWALVVFLGGWMISEATDVSRYRAGERFAEDRTWTK